MSIILCTLFSKNLFRLNPINVVLRSFHLQTSILSSENNEYMGSYIENEGSDSVFYDCNKKHSNEEIESNSSTDQPTILKIKNRKLSTILSAAINDLIDRVLSRSLGLSKNKKTRKEEIKARAEINWSLLQQIKKKYEEIKIEEKPTTIRERKILNEMPKYINPDKKNFDIKEYKPVGDEVADLNLKGGNIINRKRRGFVVVGTCLYIISTLVYLLLRTCGKFGRESLLRIYVLIAFYVAVYIFFFN